MNGAHINTQNNSFYLHNIESQTGSIHLYSNHHSASAESVTFFLLFSFHFRAKMIMFYGMMSAIRFRTPTYSRMHNSNMGLCRYIVEYGIISTLISYYYYKLLCRLGNFLWSIPYLSKMRFRCHWDKQIRKKKPTWIH